MSTEQILAVLSATLTAANFLIIPVIRGMNVRLFAAEKALSDYKLEVATGYRTKNELNEEFRKIEQKLDDIFKILRSDSEYCQHNRRSTDSR